MLETILFMVVLADVIVFSAIIGYVRGNARLKSCQKKTIIENKGKSVGGKKMKKMGHYMFVWILAVLITMYYTTNYIILTIVNIFCLLIFCVLNATGTFDKEIFKTKSLGG